MSFCNCAVSEAADVTGRVDAASTLRSSTAAVATSEYRWKLTTFPEQKTLSYFLEPGSLQRKVAANYAKNYAKGFPELLHTTLVH